MAAALELLLVVAYAAFPRTRSRLPLGGSDIAQVGIVFGLAVALTEMIEIARKF
jgi:hypothetical protein